MAQFERSVEQATANLSMLRRLKEEYEDAVFLPEEVSGLHEKCVRFARPQMILFASD